MNDPRNEERIDPYDHPSLIYTPVNNPVGDPNGKKFMEALRGYLKMTTGQTGIPLVLIGGRGPGINIRKTLALQVYDGFPDKDKWLKLQP